MQRRTTSTQNSACHNCNNIGGGLAEGTWPPRTTGRKSPSLGHWQRCCNVPCQRQSCQLRLRIPGFKQNTEAQSTDLVMLAALVPMEVGEEQLGREQAPLLHVSVR